MSCIKSCAEQKSATGRLDVVCGSMFSGKTEELIRRLRRAHIAQQKVQAFKHCLENRVSIQNLHSHSGNELAAIPVFGAAQLRMLLMPDTQIIGIDEIQFFSPDIVDCIQELIESGKHVVVAGLDMDFRGIPFGCMPTLLALADTVTKLCAVCTICGADAHFTQRVVNGKAAKFDDPIILISAQEYYQARCRTCYEIDRKPFISDHVSPQVSEKNQITI